jgi:DNA-binding SARP family transcriptional activator/class 3 adenylate cyclase
MQIDRQEGTDRAAANGGRSAGVPRGTVTFLFTDVEGSTALVRRLRDDYGTLLATHHCLLREAFACRGGHEVDTQGDAFFVAFRRARDAVEAAAAAQRAIAGEEWPDEVSVKVRIGIHTAEPGLAENGYHGLGVVRGARICSAGHGGQILLSEATRGLVDEDELEGLGFRDLGAHRLKGLEHPEHLFQLVVDGLPEQFPPLRTAAAVRTVAGREVELAAAAQAAIVGLAGVQQGLEFRILGPLEAFKDGQPLELGGQKQRALLAVFLLEAGRVIPTDRLIDALWGEHPPRTAGTSLQNFISQLRKLLGPEAIQTRPPGYLLRVEPGSLDLQRFTALTAQARDASDAAVRAALLRQALDIWRGAPLADFVYEAFAQGEIGRLEELRLVALEQRIDADLELERHADVVGELETLVRQYPLREHLRGQLMLALYRAGRQGDALQAYQEARKALVGELGIEPSPTLQELHASILRQDARLASSSQPRAGEDHVGDVARELLAGRLVPVIGDDVSALTEQLVRQFEVPAGSSHLPHVSQYVAVMRGPGPLYDAMHDEFAQPGEPSAVHRFFASLPPLLRERGGPHQLVVTTSYGLALEQAFVDAGEEFDIVAYIADGRDRGKFCHVMSTGEAHVIDEPNTYGQLSLEQRTVILRLHGHVDHGPEGAFESFVVTEDDYIHYLGNGELTSVVPVSLVAKLRRSHFLFLGYVLRDWNLRIVLHRLWGDYRVSYRSWAVHDDAVPLEEAFWRQRDVAVVNRSPEEYVEALAGAIGALRPVEVDA